MPAGKLVFSGMEFVKSSRGGSSVRISVWRGTNTGGSTEEKSSVVDGYRWDLLYQSKSGNYMQFFPLSKYNLTTKKKDMKTKI